MNFKLFQINVNNIFLNSYIQEEVYVDQHFGFKNFFYVYLFSIFR